MPKALPGMRSRSSASEMFAVDMPRNFSIIGSLMRSSSFLDQGRRPSRITFRGVVPEGVSGWHGSRAAPAEQGSPGRSLREHQLAPGAYNSPMPSIPRAYDGEDLGPRPHVAVIFRDQIGDFLVATPLMRGLRERFPAIVLDYFGGERTRELEEASRLVDARYSL